MKRVQEYTGRIQVKQEKSRKDGTKKESRNQEYIGP